MQMKLNGESQVAYIHSGMDEVEKEIISNGFHKVALYI